MRRIAIVLLLTCVQIVSGQSKIAPASPDKGHAGDKKKPEPNPSSSNAVVVIQQETTNTQNDGTKRESKSYFARLFAPENFSNIVLCIVGIGGIIVAICTLKTIREQTEATRIAAKAAQDSVAAAISSDRAWLLVEDVQVPFDSLDLLQAASAANDRNARYFTVRLRNYGQSPAFIYAVEMRYSFGGSADTPTYPGIYSQDFIPTRQQHIVPPFVNSSDVLTDCWVGMRHLEGPLQWLTDQILGEIRSSKMFLWAQGIVHYRDIHGREHETRFCYRYEVPPRVPPGHDHFCIAGPTEYNKAT